jgi:hypothetical protein
LVSGGVCDWVDGVVTVQRDGWQWLGEWECKSSDRAEPNR